MTDDFNALIRRYYENKVAALERDLQEALADPQGSEKRLRAALEEGDQPLSLIEAFKENVAPVEADGPWVEALGRKVTRAEAVELLQRWEGPISPFGQDRESADMAATIEGIQAEWLEAKEQQRAAQAAAHNESLREANKLRGLR